MAYDVNGTSALAPQPEQPRKRYIKRRVRNRIIKPSGQKLGLVIKLGILAAVLLLLCSRYVYSYDLHSEIVDKDKQLTELIGANKQIEMQIESSIDIAAVEAYAIDVLGMSMPDEHQIVRIEAPAVDVAEVPQQTADVTRSGSFWDRLFDVFDKLVAYFGK